MAASTGGTSEVDQQKVGRLVQLLAEERKLSGTEIADTLWLALKIEPQPPQSQSTSTRQSQAQQTPPPQNLGALETSDEESDHTPPERPPTRQGSLSATEPQAGVLPSKALPVWIADPAMLGDPLAIMRALKPLLQQVEAGISNKLDESATVEGIARTRLWLPVLKAQTEPWFDVVLVVDRSSSMHLWQRLAQDLERILRRYGAFRDLQVYGLQVAEDGANDRASSTKRQDKTSSVKLISNPARPGHRPSELIEQRGRRIVIVLSDCAATYWWDGQLPEVLEGWAQVMPTVVWQMLPPWMWERTALGRGTAVSACNSIPGVANQRLLSRPIDQEMGLERSLDRFPVPIVTSEPDDLRNWAAMLAGDFSYSAGSPALYSQSQRRDESQVSFAHNRDYLGSRCSFSALKQ